MKKKEVKQKINYSINSLLYFIAFTILLFFIISRIFFGPYVLGEISVGTENIISKKFYYKENKKLDKNNILARCQNDLLKVVYEKNIKKKDDFSRVRISCSHTGSMFYPGTGVVDSKDQKTKIIYLN